jgi:hypothetical protein
VRAAPAPDTERSRAVKDREEIDALLGCLREYLEPVRTG